MDQMLFELLAAWPGLLGRPDPELVADSLVLLDFLPESGRVIDVGSGGGLPGLPLKLARPALDLTLLEANGRKAAFLQQVVASLALSGVLVVRARAEAAGRLPAHREAYDIAVVRALAPMPVLAELCLPFVRVGGRLLAMKATRKPKSGLRCRRSRSSAAGCAKWRRRPQPPGRRGSWWSSRRSDRLRRNTRDARACRLGARWPVGKL